MNLKKLSDSSSIEVYEDSKFVESRGYYEMRIKVAIDSISPIYIGLGADYIGSSRYWGSKYGCCCDEIKNYYYKSRYLGGHILLPRWIKVGRTGKPRYGISLNLARAGEKGFKDRIDLFLEDLEKWYKNEKSRLHPIFQQNDEFFMLFGSYEKFVEFFRLSGFCDSPFKDTKSKEEFIANAEDLANKIENRTQEILKIIEWSE